MKSADRSIETLKICADIRNKLSPFKNLLELLEKQKIVNNEFEDGKLFDILKRKTIQNYIDNEIEMCKIENGIFRKKSVNI